MWNCRYLHEKINQDVPLSLWQLNILREKKLDLLLFEGLTTAVLHRGPLLELF